MSTEFARLVGDYLTSREAKEQRRALWKRAFMGFCIGCALALIMLALPGCASQVAQKEEVWQRVCYEKPLGQTEDGLLVVLHACLTAEQFQERNRR